MHDVITFGSATRDQFLFSEEFSVVKDKKFPTKEGLCVSAGSKIYLDDVDFATGGGGTNTAATFALQDLKVAYAGKVGDDPGGREVIDELERSGIDTEFIKKDQKQKTAYSIILSKPGFGRTILVYRGACHQLEKKDLPWHELKSEWFYIAPMSGESAKIFPDIIDFAQKSKIQVALNPGDSQISLGKKGLAKILKDVDVLMLNQEEGAKLAEVDFQRDEKIVKTLKSWTKGKVILSKGPAGVLAADDRSIYKAGIPRSGLVDRTGAGDAFGAGLISKLIKGASFEEALAYGTANATSCIQRVGAKNGLLRSGQWGEWDRVKVVKYKL